jgi:hypothetical protein
MKRIDPLIVLAIVTVLMVLVFLWKVGARIVAYNLRPRMICVKRVCHKSSKL